MGAASACGGRTLHTLSAHRRVGKLAGQSIWRSPLPRGALRAAVLCVRVSAGPQCRHWGAGHTLERPCGRKGGLQGRQGSRGAEIEGARWPDGRADRRVAVVVFSRNRAHSECAHLELGPRGQAKGGFASRGNGRPGQLAALVSGCCRAQRAECRRAEQRPGEPARTPHKPTSAAHCLRAAHIRPRLRAGLACSSAACPMPPRFGLLSLRLASPRASTVLVDRLAR